MGWFRGSRGVKGSRDMDEPTFEERIVYLSRKAVVGAVSRKSGDKNPRKTIGAVVQCPEWIDGNKVERIEKRSEPIDREMWNW